MSCESCLYWLEYSLDVILLEEFFDVNFVDFFFSLLCSMQFC